MYPCLNRNHGLRRDSETKESIITLSLPMFGCTSHTGFYELYDPAPLRLFFADWDEKLDWSPAWRSSGYDRRWSLYHNAHKLPFRIPFLTFLIIPGLSKKQFYHKAYPSARKIVIKRRINFYGY